MKPGLKQIEAVNDFVIKFANVNGSGSASANELFAKAILRMGVPVSPRNIFPSNIQGLPTWYEVRVTEKGWLGRRGGVDMMVAMNPQTWNADLKEIEPGGYLFYDNTKPLPASKFRDDITVIGMPLTEICNSTYSDPRQRQLFKNIIYIGALSALLDMDAGAIAELIGEQYKGKEKLLKPNLNALQLGRDYAMAKLERPIGLRVKQADNVGNRIFVDGNSAAALGCVYGGATVCAWYPITPSSSVAEAFERYCSKLRIDKETGQHKYAIVQAEDELASIGMVTGAGWNGAPMRRMALVNNSFAEADPEPLTLANLMTKSLTASICFTPGFMLLSLSLRCCSGRQGPHASSRSGTSACPRRPSGSARRTGRSAGTHPRPSPSRGRSSGCRRHTGPG